MTKTDEKKCPKCGQMFKTKGFNLHVNRCKGVVKKDVVVEEKHVDIEKTNEILKDIPGVAIQAGMLHSLNEERYQQQESSEQVVEIEETEEFDKTIICPSCRCTNTEQDIGYFDPLQGYRCTICGFAYQRNIRTGEYLYA
jgi:uncharacterized C2H2 Zn-finger protein